MPLFVIVEKQCPTGRVTKPKNVHRKTRNWSSHTGLNKCTFHSRCHQHYKVTNIVTHVVTIVIISYCFCIVLSMIIIKTLLLLERHHAKRKFSICRNFAVLRCHLFSAVTLVTDFVPALSFYQLTLFCSFCLMVPTQCSSKHSKKHEKTVSNCLAHWAKNV